jgi:hypothetical protein
VNFFIFNCSDDHPSVVATPSAYEVACDRLKRGVWGLNAGTRNRNQLRIGDKIVVYASGRRAGGMSFIGGAQIGSLPAPVSCAELGREISGSSLRFGRIPDYWVRLVKCQKFVQPVPIKSLKFNLDLVTNPLSPKWAIRLVGGTLRISAKDYHTILAAASGGPSKI